MALTGCGVCSGVWLAPDCRGDMPGDSRKKRTVYLSSLASPPYSSTLLTPSYHSVPLYVTPPPPPPSEDTEQLQDCPWPTLDMISLIVPVNLTGPRITMETDFGFVNEGVSR